ncbi:cobalt-precorrin 5A hydrolase [Phascolarctobacterium faecium]|uniref:cobalt-precorrin 5A hydrolase n=1 Tax=Phascolarctobacterium faecium TaxID=33025 RepID=UPI003AF1571F
MRLAVFAFSRGGCATARRVTAALPEGEFACYTMERFQEPGFLPLDKAVYGACFSSMDALVFVGACGIAVREIAPYVQSKKTDPAVLCIDERGQFVIPLLSGHIGGANALAVRLAERLDATAVVTTATDVHGRFAVDAWAARQGCALSDMGLAKAVAAEILERDVPLCSQFPITGALPEGTCAGESGALGIFIGWRVRSPFTRTLRLIPRVLHVGIGCRRGTAAEAVEAAVEAAV